LGADDAVAAVEALLGGEHVHRAALAAGIAVLPAGQLGHHALGIHARGQHVAVVAIAGDDAITRLQRHLHADHNGLLADVKMAEASDQAHAVHLAGLFLETADQQHVPVGREALLLAQFGNGRGPCRRWVGLVRSRRLRLVLGDGHGSPRAKSPSTDGRPPQ
jgi:hypothetical protein